MWRLAVTGGVACGKSTVGALLREQYGVIIRDTDHIAHELMQCGGPVYGELIDLFGNQIVRPDGEIDRIALGDLVFADSGARRRLNALVHPHVKREAAEWLQKSAMDGARAAALLVPLLHEAGMDYGWDAVICVACSRRVQLARLHARGISEKKALAMMDAQLPLCVKMEKADFVLFNDGTIEVLKKQIRKMWDQITEK